jgi:hypothetical protein
MKKSLQSIFGLLCALGWRLPIKHRVAHPDQFKNHEHQVEAAVKSQQNKLASFLQTIIIADTRQGHGCKCA